MLDEPGLPREPLYEYVAQFTDITEYGTPMSALTAGAPLPPQGLRFDVGFEGRAIGERLSGTVRGVDYLAIRADGRTEAHVRAALTTAEGERIALLAEGGATLSSSGSVLRLVVRLSTGSDAYAWVNRLHVWAIGNVDLARREVRVRAYV
jgi:hypothetical protein